MYKALGYIPSTTKKKVTLGDKVVKKLASLPTNIRRYGYCGKQQLSF